MQRSEAILPIDVEIQSLRVLVETKVLEEDWMKQKDMNNWL